MPFAPIHFTTGPVVVTFNGERLGYGEDGARISIVPRYSDIQSDDFGGQQGYPTDSQFLGAMASVDVRLTKYSKAAADSLTRFSAALVGALPNAGLLPPIGSFVRQDGLSGVLLLAGVNESPNFPVSFIRRAIGMNAGTIYRAYDCGWECWMNQTDYTALSQAQTRRLFLLG